MSKRLAILFNSSSSFINVLLVWGQYYAAECQGHTVHCTIVPPDGPDVYVDVYSDMCVCVCRVFFFAFEGVLPAVCTS